MAEEIQLNRQDLAARLRWAYPDREPVDHMQTTEWRRDLTAWHRLGKPR